MSDELVARAKAHKELNRMKEQIAGSGFHDNDKDWRGQHVAPQKHGLPRIGEHLIAFFGEDYVAFVGEDVMKVSRALTAFLEKHRNRPPYEMTGTEQKLVFQYISRVKFTEDKVVIPRGWWNDVLHALMADGLGVTGSPAVADGTTP